MIGPPEKTWMINFRVDDLDTMADQLRRSGETVDVDPQRSPTAASPSSAIRRATASSSGTDDPE